jgi:hypothetical protein
MCYVGTVAFGKLGAGSRLSSPAKLGPASLSASQKPYRRLGVFTIISLAKQEKRVSTLAVLEEDG